MWGEPEFMRSFFRGKMNQSRIFKKDSRLSWSLLTQEECKLRLHLLGWETGAGSQAPSPGTVLPLAAQNSHFQQQGQRTPEVPSVVFTLFKPEPSDVFATASLSSRQLCVFGSRQLLKAAFWAPWGGPWMGVLLTSSRGVHDGGQCLANPQQKQVLSHLLCLQGHLAAWTVAPWKPGVNHPLVLKVFFWTSKKAAFTRADTICSHGFLLH